MKIAIFALQGAFAEHEAALHKLGAETIEIRRAAHFSDCFDGVILPGGESTVQGKLLREEGLLERLRAAIEGGMPVFGTCAGLILLANEIVVDKTVWLGNLNASVRRNAYGRQISSFGACLDFKPIGDFPAVFIRAPYIEKTGEGTEVLASFRGKAVAVRQGNILATAFHPELTNDLRIHRYFLDIVGGKA